MRRVRTRVLPEPAPATTSNGPPSCTTARRCSGLRSSSRSAGVGRRAPAGWVSGRATALTLPAAQEAGGYPGPPRQPGPASVGREVQGVGSQYGQLAPLPAQDPLPQVPRLSGHGVTRFGPHHQPTPPFDLGVELAGPPTGVAGEDPQGVQPGPGLVPVGVEVQRAQPVPENGPPRPRRVPLLLQEGRLPDGPRSLPVPPLLRRPRLPQGQADGRPGRDRAPHE